ncbi:hypothetical protein DPM19_14685 [Actinomadura craniellae]|uniref:Uncharacterized protein n=1 Tax=Actinomadura craniellae TaxID=2231787 RepID=A0A365H554_9ACTN|nr:glycosyltransferase family 2 protein [Actinomadura craniellae]RAY14225.1 hypothetical protein DPM19_14685 [Actinomadura craniellae]
MDYPKVSVIIPVYNCRPSLERALSSVFQQSLGMDRIEVVAVDDGSTDGSGELLDELAAGEPRLRVVHQPNSGGPGAPRNAGIDLARGEYLLFLDADDYLGAEALERMCAMADENGTDIVIGKYVGVNRGVARWMFRRNVPRTTVLDADPGVYNTLSVLKLYRRSMIERIGLRFAQGLLSHEDLIFAARAYFAADGISVLGDYDCYYWVDREDGTSVLQQGGADGPAFYGAMTEMMRYAADQVEAGPVRDRMMNRHFRNEILPRFQTRYQTMSPAEQEVERAGARALLTEWFTPGIMAGTPVLRRLIAYALIHDRPDLLDEFVRQGGPDGEVPLVVEQGRLYAAHPRFRDPAAGIPDEMYEVTAAPPIDRGLDRVEWRAGRLHLTGTARLGGVSIDRQSLTLSLRRRGSDDEHRLPVRSGPDGYAAEVDPAGAGSGGPLAEGHWDLRLLLSAEGFETEVRVGGERPDGFTLPDSRPVPESGFADLHLRPYLTDWYENLTLQVERDAGTSLLDVREVDWPARTLLRVRGRVTGLVPDGKAPTATVRVRRRGTAETLPATVTIDGLDLVAELDVTGRRDGRWDLTLELTSAAGVTLRERIRAPEGPALPESTRRGPLASWRATPYRTDRGDLSVRVVERTLGAVAGTRLRGATARLRAR